jgi:predicted CXXCH cytochrome family protein
MNKLKTLIKLAALTALLAVPAVTQGAGGITGTKHDLSAKGWGSDQICIFCHTPHNAGSSSSGPLWNHADTTATFTLYSNATLNATVAQPGAQSKACLSCHDGTIAIDSFGGATGTHNMTGDALVGTDLSNDHPISFTYDAALATADGGLKTPPITGIPLFGGKMECATCHDVHDNANAPFLRASNAGSALCLKCHTK